MADELNCRKCVEDLDSLIAGELHCQTLRQMWRHFAVCSNCDHYRRSYQLTVRAAKAAFSLTDDVPAMPAYLTDSILSKRRSR